MDILYYNDLDYSKVKKQFERTVNFLETGDFAAAEVKKLAGKGLYRAKLDHANRLLFRFGWHNDRNYLLLLEVIYNHEYDKSRFLRGSRIDESKLEPLHSFDEAADADDQDREEMVYVNPRTVHFHLLDKVISFDDDQERLFRIKPPVIIIGSAGSGKTVLTLEKLKALKGDVLYVTLSPFLVENSARLYYANNYENDRQEIDFLSFKEFLESLKIIKGRELGYNDFERWLQPRSNSFSIKDPYKLFEEFRGVLTGKDITKEYLGYKDYHGLGIKQSIFLKEEREKVYAAFRKYLEFLEENNFYDLNMVSWRWLDYCKPRYDFIVIDEVQDFTNIQLNIVLKSLRNSNNFILCGDSNQNVHPNFFSWTNVKTMFYRHELSGRDIQILRSNYRNSVDVTGIANKLLKIKNSRFGSIDRESTYLVDSVTSIKGEVHLLSDNRKIRQQLNDRTMRSTKYAVLVMKPEEKAEARKIFRTPLVFSIQEAKGLEYPNIIALNFISGNSREFHEITKGVVMEDVNEEEITFSRGKDKSDKSHEAYKIFINSLYVAVTRAFDGLYLLESSERHEILALLGLTEQKDQVSVKQEVSSADEWQEEARKLEMQGKKEQAEAIRRSVLEITKPDWEPLTPDNREEIREQALDPDYYNKKAKDLLFTYALLYNDIESIMDLSELKYRKADQYEQERGSVLRKYYSEYVCDNVRAVEQSIRKYGVDYRDRFNLTPLLAAVQSGSIKILEFLTACGADASLTDNLGKNVFQTALYQSWLRPEYIRKLDSLCTYLITDNIKISVEDRLIKIDNHKIEYFLINFFIALQEVIMDEGSGYYLNPKGVQAGDLEKAVAAYPEVLLPKYRKNRTYLSANLSKHEIGSRNYYNKKLFKRLYRGYYVLNPHLSVWVKEQWVNVYELMRMEEVKVPTPEERETWLRNYWKQLKQQGDPRFDGMETDDVFGEGAEPGYGDEEFDNDDRYDNDEEVDADADDEKKDLRHDKAGEGRGKRDDKQGSMPQKGQKSTDTQFRLPFDN